MNLKNVYYLHKIVTGNTDVIQYEGLELSSNANTDAANVENIGITNNIESIHINENVLTSDFVDSIILIDESVNNVLDANISRKNLEIYKQ